MVWFGDATSGASNAVEPADMCEISCYFQIFQSMPENDFSAKRSFYPCAFSAAPSQNSMLGAHTGGARPA
jgi:hypothetical protein